MIPKRLALVVCFALLVFHRPALGYTLNFYWDVRTDGTWTLYGSTDAPGGIAAAVVNFTNVTGGTSIAPSGRISSAATTGFTLGNLFLDNQAFVGQYPFVEVDPIRSGAVYGIGYSPVPDNEFTSDILQMFGTASSLPVPLYEGTWDTLSSPPEVNFADAPTGAVFTEVGTPDVPAAAVIPEIRFPQFMPSPAAPGDFDTDGDVDGADFVIWQTNFPKATGASRFTGDADGDGDVDGADFVVWQTGFPSGMPTGEGVIIPPWDAPLGDFDGDGDVDGADFVAWQTNFPPPSGGPDFWVDINGDGRIDGDEFVAWLVSFPFTPEAAVVPEPAAGYLMAAALLFLIATGTIIGSHRRSARHLNQLLGGIER